MGDGNVLWAWQSQDHPGRWSIIAMFLGTEEQAASPSLQPGVEYKVLIHRDRDIVEGWRHYAEAHKRRLGQPIRLARFECAGTEATL